MVHRFYRQDCTIFTDVRSVGLSACVCGLWGLHADFYLNCFYVTATRIGGVVVSSQDQARLSLTPGRRGCAEALILELRAGGAAKLGCGGGYGYEKN